MAEVTVVVGLAALFVVACVIRYALWQRRVEPRVEEVRVQTTRPMAVVRREDGEGPGR